MVRTEEYRNKCRFLSARITVGRAYTVNGHRLDGMEKPPDRRQIDILRTNYEICERNNLPISTGDTPSIRRAWIATIHGSNHRPPHHELPCGRAVRMLRGERR